MTIDLDETAACSRALVCDNCDNSRYLSVHTVTSQVGVFCLTLCTSCVTAGATPSFGLPEAVRRSLAHCMHLGITADRMGAIMDQERTA